MKTPLRNILTFAHCEGDIRTGEGGATVKTLQVALRKGLIVADQIDQKGIATRFHLTPKGYDLAHELSHK
jgi:hypothetical protein